MRRFGHPIFIHRPDEGGSGGDVQPDEGQGVTDEAPQVQPEGQGHADASLYEEALSSVPEEHRQYVESHFKEWDRKVNEKLQSAAEYRKVWEPFEQLGIHDRFNADQMTALVEIADALADPDSAKELVRQLAEEIGVDVDGSLEDEDEDAEGVIDDEDDTPLDDLEALRREVDELREFKDSLAREDREARHLAQLQSEYAEIRKLHGEDFTEAEDNRLASLAEKFSKAGSDTPLKDAYGFISEIVGDAEANVVKTKAKEPAPAASRARASTAPEPVEDFEKAQQMLAQRMRTTSV